MGPVSTSQRLSPFFLSGETEKYAWKNLKLETQTTELLSKKKQKPNL